MLMSAIRNGLSFTEIILYLISSLAVIFITMPIHEFAHGFVAHKLGDPTPKWEGRLTLNPLAHIDYLGSAAILLFGIGWAKPVGVNPRFFKNSKKGMAIVAAAGPIANVLLAFVFLILSNLILTLYGFFASPMTSYVTVGYRILMYVRMFFGYVADISVYLAVFNLIPIPPFDGSRILFAFLPEKYYFKMMQYERYIFIALLALIYVGVLDAPISLLANAVNALISFLARLPFSLFI